MLGSARSTAARVGERIFDRAARNFEARLELARKTSPATKAQLRALYAHYRSLMQEPERLPRFSETGVRAFSQFEEDGIILFLLAATGGGSRRFVEIGAGDGMIASNCANLAFNLGFPGFVEGDRESVERGRAIYAAHQDTKLFPPVFIHAFVIRENVLDILAAHGFDHEVDVLAIDIDGNDYFIWEALETVRPRLVVMETHTEHGARDVLAPYRADYDWRKADPDAPVGASPAAMTKLAQKLGYRLVGANRFGFNTFYLRDNLGEGTIPTVELEEILRHDRNAR